MQGTAKIETKRLILNRFEENDAYAMYNNWGSNSNVTRYLTWPTQKNVKDALNVIKIWIDNYEKDNFYNWKIFIKEEQEIIGNISVTKIENDVPEIGYCIGEKWWNNGYVSEALEVVIDFLFKEGFTQINARHDINNPNSGKVMKKCGMKFIGEVYAKNNNLENALCHIYSIKKSFI